jgi:hypothetical protein
MNVLAYYVLGFITRNFIQLALLLARDDASHLRVIMRITREWSCTWRFNFSLRSQTTRRATGFISRPGCLDYVEELPVPAILDLLLPLHGHHSKGHDGELHNTQPAVVPPSDQCYVLSNRVVTFDMVSYEMEPSTCDRYLGPLISLHILLLQIGF